MRFANPHFLWLLLGLPLLVVFLWWAAKDNRASNVPVDITHAGGTTTVTVNQRINGSQWVWLGTYAFEVETASGQSGSLWFYSVLGDLQQSVDYAKNVTGVTGDDVQRVARKYLSPDSAVVVRLSK